MSLAGALIAELDRESQSTLRLLQAVPADKLDWKPHTKSMSLGQLAWHIANLPQNAVGGLRTGERDVATARPAAAPENAEFVAAFQKNLAELRDVLSTTEDATLLTERFAFKNNGEVVTSFPKLGFIRTVYLNHTYHHRGQMTVYLRLLDVPVPALYGRTADENGFERR